MVAVSLICIYHLVLTNFWRRWPGIEMINLQINILTKKRFTNLDIFLFNIIFQKITKIVIMAVAEEATDIFL